ncbi:YolD-like family protein [Niallia sp. Krafla_26]|uniref:YolD-like family protein n=1 Tax=Niallia sp. Krafla_26 TaxID=3064703 RepID=UPI003D166277
MIRDRGRIKWVSMMLPEHVHILREWAEEDTYKTKKILDEQQLEILNGVICEAMEFDYPVTIVHYRDKKYELLVGNVRRWDPLEHKLSVMDHFGEEHRIALHDIMDVQINK